MADGLFVGIDGTDGGGKKTQIDLLSEHLIARGHDVLIADFPQYGELSAGPVEMYLRGELGTAEQIGAKRAATLYAVDRFCASPRLWSWLREGKMVLSNRYVAANLAYQGAKISDPGERKAFWEWNLRLEYEFYGIPRPLLNLILDVPAEVAFDLVGKKGERAYLKGMKRDIHEEDREYLERSIEVYRELVHCYPNEFRLIECTAGGRMLPKEHIAILIWNEIRALLERSR